jgi:hypothetical protein
MDREADIVGLVVAAAFGAALSLAVTGYVFGLSDTLNYLPIIGRLYDEPTFRNDAFVQSLRHFAAGPLLLLQGADGLIAPARLLLILDCVSRFLTFLGFLACARLLGVSSRRDRAVFAILLAFASFMQGASYARGQDLFNETFSHSGLAGSLVLGAIYFAARGRLVEAFAINGLIFFCNAFVAVWSVGPFFCIIALQLWQGRMTLAQVLRRGGLGLAIFLVLASPIVANVLSNPDFGRPVGFDYKAFLVEFWPFHFLSE